MSKLDFGTFLKTIMIRRNLSAKALAEKCGIEKTASVLRLINNRGTVNSIKSFCEKLEANLDLSENEKNELERVILFEQLPESVVKSRELLTTLFERENAVTEKKLYCTVMNGKMCREPLYLSDDILGILGSEKDGSFEIYIENVNTVNLVASLYEALHSRANVDIRIHHFFRESDSIEDNTLCLYALLRLSTCDTYFPYIMSNDIYPSQRVCIIDNTAKKAFLLFVYDDTHFTHVELNADTGVMRDQLALEFKIIENSSLALRSSFASPMDELPAYIEYHMKKLGITSTEIKSTPSFTAVPFEIQKKLYDECNYIGYGKDHPTIRKVCDMLMTAENIVADGPCPKSFVFSIDGIRNFISTGVTRDYFPHFRRLSHDEIKATFGKLFGMKNVSVYLLKENYCVNYLETIVYENSEIDAFDPVGGYWENFSSIGIQNKKMLRIMRDFVNEQIITNCCYTTQESEKMINEMLDSAEAV